mmetsp:Transcript_42601/g.54775  ORF Transcript_42601/g.54775 Transcript_42601/m.54775 type:complete len:249 (+) Transcript_42601:736-1482(+)
MKKISLKIVLVLKELMNLGKGKLDALIVYGCESDVLVQAPGGRDNAKMIPKSYFTSLMLPQANGNYFLRPDRILAVFIMDNRDEINTCKETTSSKREQDLERIDDEIELELQRDELVGSNLMETSGETEHYAMQLNKISNEYSKEHHHHQHRHGETNVEEGSHLTAVMRLSDVYDRIQTPSSLSASFNEEETFGQQRRISENPLFRPLRNPTLHGHPSLSSVKGKKRLLSVKLPPASEIEMEEVGTEV